MIVDQLKQLPEWLRFLVTSRDEPAIRASLAKFEPKELRADEAKNRADVEVYLRHIAKKHLRHIAKKLSIADLEADVKREFGIDMRAR